MSTKVMRLHWLLTLAALLLHLQIANAATQLDPVAIDANDGTRLGYAHVFLPETPIINSAYPIEPIVFLPGFDINLANLLENESTNTKGTREQALKSIRELVLTQSPNPASQHPQLLENLVDKHGHTLILLEYEDDHAGVEHNAQAVELLLRDTRLPVMQHYQSSGTRSFLLGWSMGGLIGRYALTKMESEHIEHNIELYISYDVPHQGANLPLSLEAFVGLMRQIVSEQSSTLKLTTFERLLDAAHVKYNSASGSEMLKPRLGIESDDSVVSELQNIYRLIYNNADRSAASSQFYSLRDKLQSLGGYPERLKKLAISNGNFLGNALTLPLPRNGNELIRLTANVPITSRFKLKVMDVRLYDNSSENAKSNCRINYLFNTTRCPLLKMPDSLYNLSAGVGSYSNVVSKLASVFENQETLKSEWLNQGYEVQFKASVPDGEGLTTFIPMSSALDFKSINTDPATVEAADTPFDAIYANIAQNRPHNSVSPEIVDALIGEIADLRQKRQIVQALPAIY